MALVFPSNPTVGQVYQQWTWDGAKWVCTSAPLQSRMPTVQRFLTGTGTYTPPAGVAWIRVRMCAGGGGGGGAGPTGNASLLAGGSGGATTFGAWTCQGGAGGQIIVAGLGSVGGLGGSGGSNGTGTVVARFSGGNGASSDGLQVPGGSAPVSMTQQGGAGGVNPFGGGGSSPGAGTALLPAANSGGGGGGGRIASSAGFVTGGGGGGGAG